MSSFMNLFSQTALVPSSQSAALLTIKACSATELQTR